MGTETVAGVGPTTGSTIVLNPDAPRYSIEHCNGQVRWNADGKLEQLWMVKDIGAGGRIIDGHQEWRLVPTPEGTPNE